MLPKIQEYYIKLRMICYNEFACLFTLTVVIYVFPYEYELANDCVQSS
jgi:hypothetical protein